MRLNFGNSQTNGMFNKCSSLKLRVSDNAVSPEADWAINRTLPALTSAQPAKCDT